MKTMNNVKSVNNVKNTTNPMENLIRLVEEGEKKFGKLNVDFHSTFNGINDIDQLRYVKQVIMLATQEAFEARRKEIEPKTETKPSVTVNMKPKAKAAPVEEAEAEEVEDEPKTEPKKTTAKAKAQPKATKPAKEEVKQLKIAELTPADIKKMGVKFYRYSEKCIFLVGETKPIKEAIKSEAGGHWNHARKGWFLKDEAGRKLAKEMGCKIYKMAKQA